MRELVAPSQPAPVVVHLASGIIRVGPDALALTRSETAAVVAIAVQPHPAPARHLGLLLTGDREDEVSAEAAKVLVHRIRRRVGKDTIETREGGYVLGPGVRCDLPVAEALLREISRDESIAIERHESLLQLAASLRIPPPPSLSVYEWYDNVTLRCNRVGHELALRCASALLNVRRYQDAAAVTCGLTLEDPCDDQAWEVLLRAQLALGQESVARKGYEIYRKVLQRQLQTVPSESVQRLFRCASANQQEHALGYG